jgi:hypothetical protein
MTPVILYLFSNKDLQLEGRTSWSLRKASRPIGFIGASFAAVGILLSSAPATFPVTAANASYSMVVLIGTILVTLLTWRFYGSTRYSGPIRALTKWQTGVEIDIQSTLANRSRPTAPITDVVDSVALEDPAKQDIPRSFADLTPTVTVQSAVTGETGTTPPDWQNGESTGWTSTTSSGTGSTGSTMTRETVSRIPRLDRIGGDDGWGT